MQIALLFVVLLTIAGSSAVAQRSKPEPRTAVEVRLRNPADARLIEVAVADPASGRVARRPVTDLMLRLSVGRNDIDAALRMANGQPPNRDDGLMHVRLYAVSQGRLLKQGEARCDRWIEDATMCTLACDGGAFAIRRIPVGNGIALTLIAGRLPRGPDEQLRPGIRGGFSIAGCTGADDSDLLLAPAEGRSTIELAFVE